jgi:segregation and condensation protein B
MEDNMSDDKEVKDDQLEEELNEDAIGEELLEINTELAEELADALPDEDLAPEDEPEADVETFKKPEPEDEDDPDAIDATLESAIEAILFASDEPLGAQRLVNIAEVGSVKQIRDSVDSLNAQYEANGRAFRIEQIAGGYQMMTLDVYNHWLKKLVKVRTENKLSPAALETLAIIAYKQPIIRADIEAIRGVAAGEMIRNLMYKGLAKITGRAEVIGRPMLYGTTKKFLDVFGLNTLKDLPKTDDLKRQAQ